MRDKLIELINEKQVYGIDQKQKRNDELILFDNEELADHLLAEGVVVLPCKVGQTVYVVNAISDGIVEGFIEHLDYNFYTTPQEWITVKATYPFYGDFEHKSRIDLLLGKTVFLTREEAEQALKRRENGRRKAD